MLKAFISAVVVGILIIALLYLGDVVATTLGVARGWVADATNTTPVTRYSSTANSLVGDAAWITLLVVGGVLLVYSIHVRRR